MRFSIGSRVLIGDGRAKGGDEIIKEIITRRREGRNELIKCHLK